MTAHDTMRWGDVETIPGLERLGLAEFPVLVSKQLAQAHWRWPLSWNVWLVLLPAFDAAEAGTFEVTFRVTLGVGQAQVEAPIPFTLTAPYAPIIDQRFIPGENLQFRASVKATVGPTSAPDAITLAVFCAPETEPHAMTEMLEAARGDPAKVTEWMQNQPFTPEALQYGPHWRR